MRHHKRRLALIPGGPAAVEPADPDEARYAGDSAAALVRDVLDLLANRPPFDRLADSEWREQAGTIVGAALACRPPKAPPDLSDCDDELLVDLRRNPYRWSWSGDPAELQRAAEREIERRVEAEHAAAGEGARELARSA